MNVKFLLIGLALGGGLGYLRVSKGGGKTQATPAAFGR